MKLCVTDGRIVPEKRNKNFTEGGVNQLHQVGFFEYKIKIFGDRRPLSIFAHPGKIAVNIDLLIFLPFFSYHTTIYSALLL